MAKKRNAIVEYYLYLSGQICCNQSRIARALYAYNGGLVPHDFMFSEKERRSRGLPPIKKLFMKKPRNHEGKIIPYIDKYGYPNK